MEYEKFINDLKECSLCEKNFGYKPHPVFQGNKNSKIVQISQAPSKSVHETLKPFNDKSGDKLKFEWYQITEEDFYNPYNFYITGIAHCYPGKNRNGGDNKPPKICYEKWVKNELKYIDNKLYIIVGSHAAKEFFPNEKFENLVFKDNYLNNKLTFVLPHPSPLNIRWFKKYPLFEKERIAEIRNIIKKLIK